MMYPTILEYVKAIQNAGANLDRLTHLSPVLDDHGEPYHMSDVSSVVFKMQDKTTGKYYALKCFTIDPSGCADAHLLNADEQNLDASSNSSSVKSLEKELLVLCQDKEEKYPVELMEWVDEESMGAFLAADEELSTVATDEELNEAITDEFGVKYSKDGRKLLKAPQNLDGTYSVKKGTKIICDMAFYDYSSWSSLVIPDSVIIIGFGAFEGCSSLRSLVIPDSVTSIGDKAFDGWNGDLKCLSPYFIYDNKVLFDKNKSRIIAFRNKNASSYVIPYSVTRIEERTFRGCDSLRSVVIPDSVTSIGIEAFRDCSSLSSIVIPDGVTSIGDRAFQGCGSLKSLVIPDSVTCIGNYAFGGCKYLSSLVIPDSVTSIGHHAFWDCNFPNDLKQELISRFGEKIFLVTF